MKLYIMRHGQAQATASSDEARALTDVGCQESQLMATWLATQQPQFDLTFASPYLRAEQTFATVAPAFSGAPTHHVLQELTPESSPASCGDAVLAYCAQAKASSALVVSHLPLVALLVADLCGNKAMPSFTTSSIACIELDLDSWQGNLLWHKKVQDVLTGG
ncbi:MAG: phosphohistidine phosphatase SixA [Psychrobium sp.]|nr:phosphohistidine phosphatase SixA [Psychrobium sp.]